MTESVEGGAGLAWRLLATLEGGSLLLATSALLAYTARARVTRTTKRRSVKRVLITNTSCPLGQELKTKLEARCCTVSTVMSEATSGAVSGAVSAAGEIDALVVIGADPHHAHSLSQVAQLVNEDVYKNLRVMESQSARLAAGGCVAWASAGAAGRSYRDAVAAFDSVLQASLHHVATVSRCEAIWVGRYESAERAAERTLAALLPDGGLHAQGFSLRNAAHKVSEYIGRWLKIIT